MGWVAAASAWLCLAGVSSAGDLQRYLTDEQVLESHRPYLHAWRNHFNQGDARYCGGAYLDEASLMMKLGPAAPFALKQAQFEDPVIVRGRTRIMQFWQDIISVLGFKALRAYEEEGEYAPTAFAVDDNTVIVGGQFNFGGAARGHIYSETWVRVENVWMLRTAVFVIEDFNSVLLEQGMISQGTSPPPAPIVGTATTQFLEAPATTVQPPVTYPQAIVETTVVPAAVQQPVVPVAPVVDTTFAPGPASGDEANASAQTDADDKPEADRLADESAQPRSSFGGTLLWTSIFCGTCFAVFYAYRAKRRQDAKIIGGPDMLLG